MILVKTLQVGDSVRIAHAEHGEFGNFRVEHKSGRAVRLRFDMPDSITLRFMNHQQHGITWGLSSIPTAPLKAVAI